MSSIYFIKEDSEPEEYEVNENYSIEDLKLKSTDFYKKELGE